MSVDTDRLEASLREAHRPLLERVGDAADATAAGFETTFEGRPATSEPERITGPLRTILDRAGVLAGLPDVLSDLVGTAGETMAAPPVAAPPYVVVTSRGPVLRATLPAGRLVVSLRVFEPRRTDAGIRYVRSSDERGRPAVFVEYR